MIQKETFVEMQDNSGAKKGLVIHSYLNGFFPAEQVLVTLRRVVPNNLKKVKKGDKFKAVVVAKRFSISLRDGMDVRFNKNVVVILKKGEETLPIATRIKTKVLRNVRLWWFFKGCTNISGSCMICVIK